MNLTKPKNQKTTFLSAAAAAEHLARDPAPEPGQDSLCGLIDNIGVTTKELHEEIDRLNGRLERVVTPEDAPTLAPPIPCSPEPSLLGDARQHHAGLLNALHRLQSLRDRIRV